MDRICGHGREVGTQHSTAGCYYKAVDHTSDYMTPFQFWIRCVLGSRVNPCVSSPLDLVAFTNSI